MVFTWALRSGENGKTEDSGISGSTLLGSPWAWQTLGKPYAEPLWGSPGLGKGSEDPLQSHIGLSWARQTLGNPYAEPHWALLASANGRRTLCRATLGSPGLGQRQETPYMEHHIWSIIYGASYMEHHIWALLGSTNARM